MPESQEQTEDKECFHADQLLVFIGITIGSLCSRRIWQPQVFLPRDPRD